MPFNANAYRANRYARESREALATARDIKARAARGEAYDWEPPRIPGLAKLAILNARLSRSYLVLRELERGRHWRYRKS